MGNCITVHRKEYCEYQPYLKAQYAAIGGVAVFVIVWLAIGFYLFRTIKKGVGF